MAQMLSRSLAHEATLARSVIQLEQMARADRALVASSDQVPPRRIGDPTGGIAGYIVAWRAGQGCATISDNPPQLKLYVSS